MTSNEAWQRGSFELLIVDGIATVRGDLDLTNTAVLRTWLTSLDGKATTVDLSGVTFFSSTALRSFLAARRRNINLRIVRPSSVVQRVLELTDTDRYLTESHAEDPPEERPVATAG